MLCILLSKQILSIFILKVFLEAWDSWGFFKKGVLWILFKQTHSFHSILELSKIYQQCIVTEKRENVDHTQLNSAVIHLQTRNNCFILSQVTGTVWWKLDEAY